MDSTVLVALLSGLLGAIAGGVVSLASQILNRQWQKEDIHMEIKRKLYAEMSAIGGRHVGWKVFSEINEKAARCILIAGPELAQAIGAYMALIAHLNKSLDGKNDTESSKLIESHTDAIVLADKKMIALMRKELGFK